jgi:tetratricopeptide (TPR) repeat protein
MITEAPHDTPTTCTTSQMDRSSPRSDQGRRRLPWPALMAMLLCVALIGFNTWWYWRDARPAPDIKTIEALMSREQYIQAESALRERLRRSRQDGDARLLLARTLAARGDTQGCALQLREIPYWWPTKAEALFPEGQAYLMADRAKNAETCWLAVIKDDPLHPSPPDITQAASHQLLGLYATENRRDDAAEVIWETYERTSPADHLALLGMRVKNELERLAPEATIGRLEHYVAADRTDWEALRALARAELALGRKEGADRDFQACLAGRPDDPRVWRDYLSMLYDLGNQDAWTALLAKVSPSTESESEILEIPRTPERENRRLGRRGPGLSNGPELQSLRDGLPLAWPWSRSVSGTVMWPSSTARKLITCARREASYERPSANSSPPRRPGRIKRQAIQTCRPR